MAIAFWCPIFNMMAIADLVPMKVCKINPEANEFCSLIDAKQQETKKKLNYLEEIILLIASNPNYTIIDT